ncbi:hypothetical protein LSAT2_019042, partial [Lamellibrachia satsuma]
APQWRAEAESASVAWVVSGVQRQCRLWGRGFLHPRVLSSVVNAVFEFEVPEVADDLIVDRRRVLHAA